jgi:hypothetical protein
MILSAVLMAISLGTLLGAWIHHVKNQFPPSTNERMKKVIEFHRREK